MDFKVDKTTKILLGAIALGLFLNVSNVFIDKAYASDCATSSELRDAVSQIKSTIRLWAPYDG
jgi:hypothetical protein